MDLYSLNKELVNNLPDMKDFTASIELINNFSRKKSNKHYMLLGKDISYYTVLERTLGFTETMGEAVIECLKNIGNSIKNIEEVEDGIECWVIPTGVEKPVVLYLFPYDYGVCPVGV